MTRARNEFLQRRRVSGVSVGTLTVDHSFVTAAHVGRISPNIALASTMLKSKLLCLRNAQEALKKLFKKYISASFRKRGHFKAKGGSPPSAGYDVSKGTVYVRSFQNYRPPQ